MLKYTLCFIVRGDEVLMLNRERPSWMGCWNGLGGKLLQDENATECIKREVFEEANIKLYDVKFSGIVSWCATDGTSGGMYVFIAYLPQDYCYAAPIKTDEGILDWKKLNWLLNVDNIGVAYNIRYFLSDMLSSSKLNEYKCEFDGYSLLDVNKIDLDEKYFNEL